MLSCRVNPFQMLVVTPAHCNFNIIFICIYLHPQFKPFKHSNYGIKNLSEKLITFEICIPKYPQSSEQGKSHKLFSAFLGILTSKSHLLVRWYKSQLLIFTCKINWKSTITNSYNLLSSSIFTAAFSLITFIYQNSYFNRGGGIIWHTSGLNPVAEEHAGSRWVEALYRAACSSYRPLWYVFLQTGAAADATSCLASHPTTSSILKAVP